MPRDTAHPIRRYALPFIASVLLANAIAGDRGALEMRRARVEYRALVQSIAALRAENSSLRQQARLLRTDRRVIEAIARQDLGMARRDERLVIVTQPE